MTSWLIAALLIAGPVIAVDNGLARKPQMGWNNWNSLGCTVSEDLLLDTSKVLLHTGLRDIGYQYVVLDDCWQDFLHGRGDDGFLCEDKDKFPHGMKWVAQRLHDDGLLFGMYSSAGELTCARFVGSLDHEEEDARAFASWDVDYLKYDNCYHRGRFGYPAISFDRYEKMASALNSTGRPILYSLCNWGEDYVHTWGSSFANSWRISGDIYDSFNRPDDLCACDVATDPHCVAPGNHCSVMNVLNKVAPMVDRSQKGGWNDLDCLEVGLGGMTDNEYIAHFSLWAALKSPLLIGADLRKLNAKALSILNNPAIVAINQDPLGQSVARISYNRKVKKDKYDQGEVQIWSGPLYPHDQVVVFLNTADEDMQMAATLAEIFVHEGPEGSAPQTQENFDLYDPWATRMDESTAQKVLDGEIKVLTDWYNATTTPYVDGLKSGDERLLGKKVGSIGPNKPELEVDVPRHSVRVFRLRNVEGKSSRYVIRKDEL